MELWYPDAIKIPFKGPDGGAFVDDVFQGILHTTESRNYYPSQYEYYGHKNPPHYTLHGTKMYQHFPNNRASRALQNRAGGVQTNRHAAIQIEIVWNAKDINDMPDANWQTLRTWMRWIEGETGIKPVCPEFGDSRQYGYKNPAELTNEEWESFNGWCGHQHVPENAHWDPGPISQWGTKWLGLNVVKEGADKPSPPADLPKINIDLATDWIKKTAQDIYSDWR